MATSAPKLSAKQAAIELGTDARTLRKFLRTPQSGFEPVGQGGRYEFGKKEMTRLTKAFNAWSGDGTKKSSNGKKPLAEELTHEPPDGEEEYDQDDDIEPELEDDSDFEDDEIEIDEDIEV